MGLVREREREGERGRERALSFDLLFYVSVWQMLCLHLVGGRWKAERLKDCAGEALTVWHFKANSREVHFKTSKRDKSRRDLSTRCPYVHLDLDLDLSLDNCLTGRCASPKRATADSLVSVPTSCLSVSLNSIRQLWLCAWVKSEFMLRCCNNWCWKMMAMTKWLRLESGWKIGSYTQVHKQSELKLRVAVGMGETPNKFNSQFLKFSIPNSQLKWDEKKWNAAEAEADKSRRIINH